MAQNQSSFPAQSGSLYWQRDTVKHLNKVLFNLHYFIIPPQAPERGQNQIFFNVLQLTTYTIVWQGPRGPSQKEECESNAYLFSGPRGLLAYSKA